MRFVLGSSGSHTHIVASRGFSGVKNHIGVVHDLIDAAIAEFICEGESNTDCHRKALLPHQKWLVSSALRRTSARETAPPEWQRLSVPPGIPRLHSAPPCRRNARRSAADAHLAKHSIAAHMAEAVVDPLEMIDIAHHHRGAASFAPRTQDITGHQFDNHPRFHNEVSKSCVAWKRMLSRASTRRSSNSRMRSSPVRSRALSSLTSKRLG